MALSYHICDRTSLHIPLSSINGCGQHLFRKKTSSVLGILVRAAILHQLPALWNSLLNYRNRQRSLIDLVRQTTRRKAQLPSETTLTEDDEGGLIELLFGIASKIRLDPAILSAWFYPERDVQRDEGATVPSFVGVTRTNAFPLFYLLIEYVYHDGRPGDFARTGLLYLIETASKSKSLEQWMIESDLATIMASGLGALYSRLSTGPPQIEDENLPLIISLSDYERPSTTNVVIPSDSQRNVDAFLSYLMFWQDTLDHCTSAEVSDTLLDHFQVLFLQQLLYPSILESSDVEGGSTASVVTCLYRILTALQHPVLVERILHYLLATTDESSGAVSPTRLPSRMSLSRRKSLTHLALLAGPQSGASPALFSLLDLMILNLKSQSAQTVMASLKLLNVLVQRHHHHAKHALFRTTTLPAKVVLWSISAMNLQLAQFFSLATEIIDDPKIGESYENVLGDVSALLESHSCLAWHGELDVHEWKLHITPSCPLWEELTGAASSFFSNQTMTNLALTEAILSISCCGNMSLDGWLVQMKDSDERAEDGRLTVYSILACLVDQVKQWRLMTPDWEELIILQKAKLVGSDINVTRDKVSNPGDLDEDHAEAARRSRRRGKTLQSEVFGDMDDSEVSSPIVQSQSNGPSSSAAAALFRADYLPAVSFSDASIPTGSVNRRPPVTSQTPLDTRVPLLQLPPSRKASQYLQSQLAEGLKDELASPGLSAGDSAASRSESKSMKSSASLNHVLTNAVILQEFILELAAVIQLRASTFEEVDFE